MWPVLNPDDPTELLQFSDQQIDFGTSPSFANLAAGGWGSGKTISGLSFIALSAWSSPPRSVGIAIMPSYPMLSEWLDLIFLPAFEKIKVGHQVSKRCIILPGGRRLYYRSGSEPKSIQMTSAAYVLMDEPHLMAKDIFYHAIGRIRKKNARCRFGLTSLPKVGWLSKEFDGKDDSERRCLHFRTDDNKHLDPKYAYRLRKACPASQQACYLDGKFVPAGGSVYPEMNKKSHIIPWMGAGYIKTYLGEMVLPEVNVVIDWSVRRPHVLWIQRIPPGIIMPGGWRTEREISIVIDEIYPDGEYNAVTTPRLCNMILNRKNAINQRHNMRAAVCDPAGNARQSQTGESEVITARKLLKVPILYQHGKRINIGIQHVQLALEPLIGHPYLFFSENLLKNPDPCAGHGDPEKNEDRAVINAMQGYSYPEEKDGKLPDDPDHDDIYSHACDCVRYHVEYFYPEDRLSVRHWSAA